jgi:hypothetical protein
MSHRLAAFLLSFVLCSCSQLTITVPDGGSKPTEICDDRADNDGDLKTDCGDPECFSSPTCCLDLCNAGASLCDVGGVRTCEPDPASHCLHFGAAVACQQGVCSGGICAATCTDQCSLGARVCASTGAVVECQQVGTGCTDWVQKASCAIGDTCAAGACIPVSSCTNACTLGATRTSAMGQQQVCIRLASGCTDWGFPTAACNPATCSGCCAGAVCVTNPSAAACGNSANACVACASGSACVAGSCADVDECLTGNGGCDIHGSCTNTVGSRTCACAAGYTGNGVSCAAVSTQLSALGISAGTLSPVFGASTVMYAVSVASSVTSVTVTPTAQDAAATIRVNAAAVASGTPSQPVSLTNGMATVSVAVSNGAGASTTYGVVFIAASAGPALQSRVMASNADVQDFFGEAVAISGDTLVVGANYEDGSATGVNGSQTGPQIDASGAVYVFVRSGGVWVQQAYLKASNTGAGDHFGGALALSGDSLAVGAYLEDSSATGVNGNQADDSAQWSGAVYVFVRNGTIWSQQAYVKASNTRANALFGANVALEGDTLVVGSYGENSAATGVNGNQSSSSATQAGAAYVFVRSGTAWSQQAYLKASNTGANDAFGVRCALSGNTLAISAELESSSSAGVNGNQYDNSASGSGAVYVFVRSGTAWTQQAYLKASNPGADDHFGLGLAIAGDTLAVGAEYEDSTATGVNGNQADNSALNSGAAYVFVRSGTTWTQQAYLKASNTEAGDGFGYSLGLSGDTLAVGAYGEDSAAAGVNGDPSNNSMADSGAAYVFERTGQTWTQKTYLKASVPEAGARFSMGYSLWLDGTTLGVAAADENGGRGAAYVFSL